MKLLLATLALCATLGNAAPSFTGDSIIKEKNEKNDKKKKSDDRSSKNKNMHSVKKWRMTVEYTNGSVISKTIIVAKNSELSALETAFKEADKYLKRKNNVKNYSISPVTNDYVLLAGD
ncbi:hypothetical protein D1816_04660 [Aquimarina sp. AD10]|uniref:Uncharacterized protein n=1 Tax=Aquimarina aggregata TaxID=1642818 RepID=A0A162CX29_9FLAO|nr:MULTISPECIES: hypothetical protein [Aquimarina]AXT59676.1 hypothetical protein D1816_04660 [Aquimarina sp. AD10]KZS42339.1 hypothetical protein AWE51_02550 [Aquimarina aggregata]RKM97552.1 hypothetical protein D7033_14240 [Aquimarina sp. AD10]